MNVQALLPLPVVIPIAGAICALLLGRLHRRLPLLVGIVAMAASLGVLLVIASRVLAGHGHVITVYFSDERPFSGRALGIAFSADPFGIVVALLAAALGAVLLTCAMSELGHLGRRELGLLACLSLLMLAGVIGAALTDDLINLFVWFEVAGLASFGLTGFFLEQPTALEAAFKATVLTSIGGFVIFTGSAMLYTVTGALNLGQLQQALPDTVSHSIAVGVALVVCGYAVKAGLVPFHAWLPDAHAAGPGAVSAMFSAILVDLGVVGLVRMLICTRLVLPRLDDLLMWLGITSGVVGALMALAQDDLKRLLAWDTVSQSGIIVVGFASNNPEGIAGAVYHLANHGLFKALLFLSAGAVLHATGLGKLSELGGLWRQRRVLTAGFTVGALAISGVPPLNGYASLGLIHQGIADKPAVHLLAAIAQVLTVAALARATYLGFYRPRAQEYEHLETQHVGMRISLGSLAIGCAAFGVLPALIVPRIAAPAASFVLFTGAHAAGVTTGVTTLPDLSIPAGLPGGTDLLTSLAEVIIGILLAAAYIRWGEPRPVGWLRRLHTGSVNDYATFAVAGLVLVCVTLLA